MSIQTIENLARDYVDAREALAERVKVYQDEVEKLKRKLFPGILRTASYVTKAHELLHAEIERRPELFTKPKSLLVHGVRVGYQKAKGTIAWEDEDQVIKLIKKHFADQAEVLIKTTEKPVKTALAQLAAADLKRIGVTVKDASDEVVIKPVDGEIEKLVDALLKAEGVGEATE